MDLQPSEPQTSTAVAEHEAPLFDSEPLKDNTEVIDMVEGRDEEPGVVVIPEATQSVVENSVLKPLLDRPGVTRIPGMAFDAMVSAIARKLSRVRRKYGRVPTFAKNGGDHYQFETAMTDRGMMVRMTVTKGAVRQAALPGEIQQARQKSGEAHNRLQRAKNLLETERIKAAPVYTRAATQTDWRGKDYADVTDETLVKNQESASQSEKADCDRRIAEAEAAVAEAESVAKAAQKAVEDLMFEMTNVETVSKVWTIEEINDGAVLPDYKVGSGV